MFLAGLALESAARSRLYGKNEAFMTAKYPLYRPRRLRAQGWMRDLVRENSVAKSDLIWPIFVREGENLREAVPSMEGVERLSVDLAVEAAREARDLGIPMLALFPYTDPAKRDERASEALNADNLVNRATRAIKDAVPEIGVMLDVALDPYSSHGHDGILQGDVIDNDATIEVLIGQSLVQAKAGADVLGPSDMMDGRIGAIRAALESEGLVDTAIMAYSAKYASAFYGPFRDAVGASGVLKGDKKTYQMDYGNAAEALDMIGRDLDEGADMVMVKPGLAYLDICTRVVEAYRAPVFAYQVSGEYAMIQNAITQGLFDEKSIIMENMMSFKRAGCRGVLTYFAPRIAKWLD